MKIGLIGDLHIGDTGEGRWHNRQMLAHAQEIAQATISHLNSYDLDWVVALGDITQGGLQPHLAAAYDVLSEIACPWLVLPGNHDRAAVQDGSFARAFEEHVPPPYLRRNGIGIVSIREVTNTTEMQIGLAAIESIAKAVAADSPPLLWIFSHFPLTSEETLATRQGGPYAGHYADGGRFINRLREVTTGPIVGFSAHLHWHHITQQIAYHQCTTGALVEYPMESRIVSVDETSLTVSTLETTVPTLAAASLDGRGWVRGRDRDRQWSLTLAAS